MVLGVVVLGLAVELDWDGMGNSLDWIGLFAKAALGKNSFFLGLGFG